MQPHSSSSLPPATSFFKQRLLIDELLFPNEEHNAELLQSLGDAQLRASTNSGDSVPARGHNSTVSGGALETLYTAEQSTVSEPHSLHQDAADDRAEDAATLGGPQLGFVARLLLHARRCFHPDVAAIAPPDPLDYWFTFMALKVCVVF